MLENLEPIPQRRPCKLQTVKETLEPKDQELLMVYVNDVATWSHHRLSRALASRGVQLGFDAIHRHRAGLCSCSKA